MPPRRRGSKPRNGGVLTAHPVASDALQPIQDEAVDGRVQSGAVSRNRAPGADATGEW